MRKPILYTTGTLSYLIALSCIVILGYCRFNDIQLSAFHALLVVIGLCGGICYALWALYEAPLKVKRK